MELVLICILSYVLGSVPSGLILGRLLWQVDLREHVWLEIEPLPAGSGNEFTETIFGGSVPRQYIPAVEKGTVETLQGGVLAGYPVVDVKVNLYDGSYHAGCRLWRGP